jgi:hypothetical protein
MDDDNDNLMAGLLTGLAVLLAPFLGAFLWLALNGGF